VIRVYDEAGNVIDRLKELMAKIEGEELTDEKKAGCIEIKISSV
jgi:hypothetical protein